MLMKWSRLVELLERDGESRDVATRPQDDVWSALRLSNEPLPEEQTILYFLDEGRYRQIEDSGNRSWVVLCSDPTSFSPSDEGENVLVYGSEADFEKAYLDSVSLLAQEQNLSRGLGTIMAMIMNDDGTQQVIDAIAELFDSPAALVDHESNVLAYSESRTLPPSLMGDELRQGHLRTRSYTEMVGAGGGQQNPPEPVRFAVRGTRGSVICYVTNVYLGSASVGSLLLFTDERGLSQMAVDYLSRITNVLSIEMRKNGVYTKSKANYISYILADTLDNPEDTSHDEVAERLHSYGIKLRRYLHVLLVDAGRVRRSSTELNILAHRIQDIVDGTIYLVRNSAIICLVSQGEPAFKKKDLDKLTELAFDAEVSIGVSDVFEDVAEMSEHLTQAEHSIDVGERLQPASSVFEFEKLDLYDFVSRVPSDLPVGFYEYRPLLALREYDRANGTQLLETLVLYLEMPRDTALVCEKLGVHRNTLYYRLKKINEIMGVDVDNGLVITKTFLTLAMLRCNGRLRDTLGEDGIL